MRVLGNRIEADRVINKISEDFNLVGFGRIESLRGFALRLRGLGLLEAAICAQLVTRGLNENEAELLAREATSFK